MKKHRSAHKWFSFLATASVLTFALSGCGSDGDQGAAGAPGATVGVASAADATALTITVTGVTINSAPVVNFTVTNQNGVAVSGFADTDLRFNIAKLVPGSNGDPSKWQSYLNRVSGGGVLGTQERAGSASAAWGTLVDHKNGTFTYTFKTDITNPTANPCPAPCTDADGNALDISYQAGLTHRVGIQQNNTALPKANATFDFVPAGGAVSTTREIVTTASCNECHNQLAAHGGGMRIETKLCVTCHNPGSWDNTPGNVQTLDFKMMVHKIHEGEELPSVVAGTPYAIGTHDYSDVVFPQDIRNCTKCHDGADAATPQGDNWKNRPNMAACGSCHDNVYFGASPDPLKPYQTVAHPGGVVTDNSECMVCHGPGRIADTALEHTNPVKVAGAKFKFNIIDVTGGTTPSIQFSVTDPTNADAPYDIAAGDAATNPIFKTPSTSRLAIDVGWSTTDFTNNTSGVNPAQPLSIDPVNACDGTPVAGWSCTGPVAGVYTLTKLSALPTGATGTGRVAFEGHPAALDSATPPAYTVRVPVKNTVKDWSIDGSTLAARRTVVDIAKCNQCHDQLSLHGNNRTDEPQVCVMCHNPNDTDANRRPKTAAGILSGATVDGKLEESIDFKHMIHGIHGAAMRDKGVVVYGFGGSANDFSGVRFPGILNDCTTCHTTSSYQLTGIWETPSENGILGSTISTTPTAVDAGTYATQLATPDDDLNITPTAAVCSSCHDGALAQQHMISVGAAAFDATQAVINTTTETCSICHGPGSISDVKTVHGVK